MGKHDSAITKLKTYYEDLEDRLEQSGKLYAAIYGKAKADEKAEEITKEMDSIYKTIEVLKELNEDE